MLQPLLKPGQAFGGTVEAAPGEHVRHRPDLGGGAGPRVLGHVADAASTADEPSSRRALPSQDAQQRWTERHGFPPGVVVPVG